MSVSLLGGIHGYLIMCSNCNVKHDDNVWLLNCVLTTTTPSMFRMCGCMYCYTSAIHGRACCCMCAAIPMYTVHIVCSRVTFQTKHTKCALQ